MPEIRLGLGRLCLSQSYATTPAGVLGFMMLRLPWGSLAVELKRKKHQTHPDGTMTSQKLKPVDPIGALNDRFPLLSLGELQSEAARIEEAIQNTALASIMHLFSQNKSFRPSGQSEFIFNPESVTAISPPGSLSA